MSPSAEHKGELRDIPVDLIDRNPENPRIVFRPREMSQLLDSIRKLGVQVPVSVYKAGTRYVLIDGERRWRCSIKLNRRAIPALVQDRPDQLSNLLLMFNIHALREQWDLLTISLKLPRVVELLQADLGRAPKDKEISAETGLNLAVITRSKLLMALPDHHRQTILKELHKPKAQQRLTEDFFIEMERALKTVERAMPEVLERVGKEAAREHLIEKYSSRVIPNIVHFRQLGKIARADRVSADRDRAASALRSVLSRNRISIEKAYSDSVGFAYTERDVVTRATSLAEQLALLSPDKLDADVREALRTLLAAIKRILGAR